MKSIVILCDGSWQDLTQSHPTNVARLARLVTSPDTQPQVVYYDDGVGVAQGVVNHLTHLLGGAFGEGLDYKLARAYEFICLNYTPGDRLFLFGFSRGAYTVRSLAGLMRQVWILRREEASRTTEAVALYRQRPATSDDPETAAWTAQVRAFQQAWSWPVEDAFTDSQAVTPGEPTTLEPKAAQAGAWVQHLGVWETVGSLGIPSGLPFASTVNRKYAFHDLSLSRFVRSARQAAALDERRATFMPSLWNNVDALNVNTGASGRPYADRPYQQQWFPGAHSSVGGGGASRVSLAPLLWIAEGAARAGLALDLDQVTALVREVDPVAAFDPEPKDLGSLALEALGLKWRVGPQDLAQISLSAKARLIELPGYDPGSLTPDTRIRVRASPLDLRPVWYAP